MVAALEEQCKHKMHTLPSNFSPEKRQAHLNMNFRCKVDFDNQFLALRVLSLELVAFRKYTSDA